MNTVQLTLPFLDRMPGLRIYNIRITPPEPVFSEIKKLKSRFRKKFGFQELVKSQPHITLTGFVKTLNHELILLDSLRGININSTINVEIEGFDIFNPNVLILKVSDSQALYHLRQEIWKALAINAGFSCNCVENPHITISKTRDMKQLHESLNYFKQFDYPRSFAAKKLDLVSRESGQTWTGFWELQLK